MTYSQLKTNFQLGKNEPSVQVKCIKNCYYGDLAKNKNAFNLPTRFTHSYITIKGTEKESKNIIQS